jgi:hypothetical protein
MRTCPQCHRAVADDATVCPHADCRKPLTAATRKRPPPPGPVRLTSSDLPHAQAAKPSSPHGDAPRSWRGPLATLALFVLLMLLVGGIYYAAIDQKPANVEGVDQVARQPEGGQRQPQGERVKTGEGDAAAKTDVGPGPPGVTTDGPKRVAPVEGVADKNIPAEKVVEKTAAAAPAEPLGLYSERTRVDRKTWIGQVGGTPESELAVADGLDWLARHQAEDGHWGPDCLGPGGLRCEQQAPCSGKGGRFEAALTGLAVLAFQAGGNYDFNDHPYSDHVRRGLDWLAAQQGPNGQIVGSLNRANLRTDVAAYQPDWHPNDKYMYEHAIATFALAESCAVARAAQRHADESHLNAALKAVQFIESQQHDDGGWRYHPNKSEPSDASVSGWAMLALKTAIEADLPVDKQVVSRMVAFFKSLEEPLTGRTHYVLNVFGTDALTGVGMMVDEFVLKQPNSELVQLAAPYLADHASVHWGEGRNATSDFYLWYNCTLAMFQAGGDPWKQWNDVIRNHLISLQLHGSDCVRGSWEPQSHWGESGGRIYTTALAVLTLEVYYRFARDEALREAAPETPATQP